MTNSSTESTYTMLPTPPPPPQNDTGLESAFGKALLKEKYHKSAWKFERYDVAFLDSSVEHTYHESMDIVGDREPRGPTFSSLAHMNDGCVSQSRWNSCWHRSKGS
ncbi:hypothetical protein ARMGADRAFT_1087977 [Armillaria gallica]|uniref:Uncharacterized protein n=1 Tax=Armillaria gallica TaxID=47427 RepID=A0A2H3D204_ARMGA|nr:hypothetical protein ARMGADRAFT_1087977 [Armillaria gallica]